MPPPFPLQRNAISYYYPLQSHACFSSSLLSQSHQGSKKRLLRRAPSVSILELARPHDDDDVYCIPINHRAKSPLIGNGSRDGALCFRRTSASISGAAPPPAVFLYADEDEEEEVGELASGRVNYEMANAKTYRISRMPIPPPLLARYREK